MILLLFGAVAVTPARGAPELSFAEVVLSVPGCALFVVKIANDFTVVREREHWALFEGDQVRGTLHAVGNSELEILGEMSVGVTVEDWGLDLKASKRLFYHSCIPDRERFLDLPDLTVHHDGR
jgi:hypothetical protein